MKDVKEIIKETLQKIEEELKDKKSGVFFDDEKGRIFWDFTEHSLIAKKSVLMGLLKELNEE